MSAIFYEILLILDLMRLTASFSNLSITSTSTGKSFSDFCMEYTKQLKASYLSPPNLALIDVSISSFVLLSPLLFPSLPFLFPLSLSPYLISASLSHHMPKTLDKNQTPLMIKVLEKLGSKGEDLNMMKSVYSKPIDSIKLNEEKFKEIPQKSGTIQSGPLSFYLLNIVCEYLARAIRQLTKREKGDTNWKGIM